MMGKRVVQTSLYYFVFPKTLHIPRNTNIFVPVDVNFVIYDRNSEVNFDVMFHWKSDSG